MFRFLIFIVISLIFLKAQALKPVELKSLKPNKSNSISQVKEINCEFSGLTTQKQKLVFSTEKFLLSDLRHTDDTGNKGIYVNVFDFFGYRFHIDDKKKLVVRVEKEETLKKVVKNYSRLPASLISKVSFSTSVNNKSVNFKEVTVVCR